MSPAALPLAVGKSSRAIAEELGVNRRDVAGVQVDPVGQVSVGRDEAPPDLHPFDLAIASLRALVLTGRPDPEELREQRAALRRVVDPLDPRRLERRRRERRVELSVRRGADRWDVERRARAEASRRCEEGRARRLEWRAREAEVEALEAEVAPLVAWLNDEAPRPLRQVVRALAWAHRGREAWERRTRPTYADLLDVRAAVVAVLSAPEVGFCRFPLARVS